MRAWIDGDLLADPTQGAVAVTDHGFTVGDGVFEAVKTLDGVPFALTRHLARLERSASGLGPRAGWRCRPPPASPVPRRVPSPAGGVRRSR